MRLWVLFLRNFVANQEKQINVLWSERRSYNVMAIAEWHHRHWGQEWSHVWSFVVGILRIRRTLIPLVNPQDEKLCLHFNKRSVTSQFLGTSRSENCSFGLLTLNPNHRTSLFRVQTGPRSEWTRVWSSTVAPLTYAEWRIALLQLWASPKTKASPCWMKADQRKVWDSKNFCCNRICDRAPRHTPKWSKSVFCVHKQGHLQETLSTSAAH